MAKEFAKVKAGGCARQWHAKYVNGILGESTSSMHLGQYFEYCLTGALPKSGEVPQPAMLKTGKMSEPYARATERAEEVKSLMSTHFENTPFVAGQYLEREVEGIPLAGTLDLSYQDVFGGVIVDIKYSGMLDNKWDDFGWHPDSLGYKQAHMMQAIHYSLLYEHDPRFFFFVVSSATTFDYQAYEVLISEESKMRHMDFMREVYAFSQQVGGLDSADVPARPSRKRCDVCPIRDTCQSVARTNEIITITCEI